MSGRGEPSGATLVTPSLLRQWPLPAPGGDKYSRGSVLVVGGARATPGAALLAGVSALRAGAGKLTLAVAESVAVQLGVALPECGAVGLAETAGGSVKAELDRMSAYLDRADTILVGPGLDDPDLAGELMAAMLDHEAGRDRGPDGDSGDGGGDGTAGGAAVVLDAYALGALVPLEDRLDPWRGRLILTPNPTEAGILLGRDVDDLEKDLAEISSRFDAVVSCQGLITQPPGLEPDEPDLWKITTGYGGLGTSGSGDVLAGAIAGLRARGTSSTQAACWGTHLHAAAADRLASRLGPLGFLARELADELPALMLEFGV